MNGKGSRPRNNYSEQFRKNHDDINWNRDYYWVFEHGRPCGLDNIIYVGSVKEAKKAENAYSTYGQVGTQAHQFLDYKQAERFIRSHVQNKELNQVIIPSVRFREGQE